MQFQIIVFIFLMATTGRMLHVVVSAYCIEGFRSADSTRSTKDVQMA